MIHVSVVLANSALEFVEGLVWTAHTTVTSRGCQHVPCFQLSGLVGDSAAVSLRYVMTLDPIMSF